MWKVFKKSWKSVERVEGFKEKLEKSRKCGRFLGKAGKE